MLVEAGIRSFKIEGRYRDLGYVKNITAHYRRLFDEPDRDVQPRRHGAWRLTPLTQGDPPAAPGLARVVVRPLHHLHPDPGQNFNRSGTDYFVNGRQIDIGAFDTPKFAGIPLGDVLRVGPDHFDIALAEGSAPMNNGDGLTWWDLQGELQGGTSTWLPLDETARHWRLMPNEPMSSPEGPAGTARCSATATWPGCARSTARAATGASPSTCGLDDTDTGLLLTVTDEDGHVGQTELATARGAPAMRP